MDVSRQNRWTAFTEDELNRIIWWACVAVDYATAAGWQATDEELRDSAEAEVFRRMDEEQG